MKRPMKSSKKIRNVIVKWLGWEEELKIDSSVFDDIYMEAATRSIEMNKNVPNFTVAAIMECYDKKDINNPNKHYIYNTYFVLVNAAMYEQAEMLRSNFLKMHGIDLQKESIRGDDDGKSGKKWS